MVLQGYKKMGQCASKRASKRPEFNKSIKELSSKKVWMMVKIEEFEALQNSASESQKDIDKMRKQFLCQSTLLKEIIDDMLKLQNNENEELKQRIQKLETAFAESALAQPSSMSAVTTTVAAVGNAEHFV
jgi:predicted  nucleic acid-binding Zn-ribbon protein